MIINNLLPDIPVIACTAFGGKSDIEKLYFCKDFLIQCLVVTKQEWLKSY